MVQTTRASGEKVKALVTGGAGFLGQHLVQQLVDSGRWEVTVFDIREAKVPGAITIIGDLRNPQQVEEACKGMEVVFHCATAAPTGAGALNKSLMDGVNVQGTKNIISACQACKVTKLVATSSASVVFDGHTLQMVEETHDYAQKPMDYYTKTKIESEQLVLTANGVGGVATCALRPSGIFGEGDPLFVPTVAKQAANGKMKYVIGNGKNEMDFTYVGNVAQAHIQAAEALSLDSALAGSAYFITNQQPLPFWTMMGHVVEGLGYRRPYIHLPFLLIITIAFIFEYIIRPLISPIKTLETDFTVNRILLATTERTFSCAKAKRDFGYVPKVSMEEGIKRTLKSFQHLRKKPESSKCK
jgi:sterol-4alpha-carboxylate 3-dehydrogenase (decarboxylating)